MASKVSESSAFAYNSVCKRCKVSDGVSLSSNDTCFNNAMVFELRLSIQKESPFKLT